MPVYSSDKDTFGEFTVISAFYYLLIIACYVTVLASKLSTFHHSLSVWTLKNTSTLRSLRHMVEDDLVV